MTNAWDTNNISHTHHGFKEAALAAIRQREIDLAQVYATLAVSEALVDSYGSSLAEVVSARGSR